MNPKVRHMESVNRCRSVIDAALQLLELLEVDFGYNGVGRAEVREIDPDAVEPWVTMDGLCQAIAEWDAACDAPTKSGWIPANISPTESGRYSIWTEWGYQLDDYYDIERGWSECDSGPDSFTGPMAYWRKDFDPPEVDNG